MEKINVAELLRNCPKGMELDCTMYENVYFGGLSEDKSDVYPITVNIIDDKGNEHDMFLTKEGCCSQHLHAKCVIFPKGKSTWEGFVPPCQFKDGDIVATDSGRWLGIIKNKYDFEYYTVHCAIDYTFNAIFYRCGEYCFSRFANEEEKSILFKAIKDNGYKWNPETKTLEKIGYQYPKTYEECCKILNICPNGDIVYAGNWVYGGDYLEKHLERIRNFQKLRICRDAYWKIAGEQMGLGKPWKQDYNDRCFIIANNNGNIHTYEYHEGGNVILAFPTAEMRDAFLENFGHLIEICKELL